MPAIDKACLCGAWLKLTEVAVVRGEVAHAFVCFARLVLFVRLDQFDRVVKNLEGIIDRNLKSDFDVFREGLVLYRLEELRIDTSDGVSAKEATGLA